MIPKIIHYSWFSNDPIPEHIQKFIEKWRVVLPDYEIVLWDGPKLKEIDNTFANEAVSQKKWAFASDFLRFYVVYHYGGIWFDSDIEVFKSFDQFLNNRLFVAREAGTHGYGKKERWLTAHCFGAEKGHPLIEDCLSFYTDRHFIRSANTEIPTNFRYEMILAPQVMAIMAKKYGYDDNGFIDRDELIEEGIHIYPSYFFDSPQYRSMKNVYSIHREAGGWRAENKQVLNFKGTNPKKGRLFHKLKTFIQKQLLQFNIAIIRIR
ncbi:glycosyltransferase family 32 protein [Leeuwenhoekiella aestuarii]|uniref:Capsular polysaccharide synthesis protein n=1 Tax=Leeuwenhoekiella aestuarii TaxID=2249426 RepID=A0A4Q0NR00_9FLAO|nr:capsular polysaccharide synthesis protein [Leeuwenhoekiella aestuarii]RXG13096.1 capsular polysaccharide synthesis protein [Leeuwenhoekiella aestuarii]